MNPLTDFYAAAEERVLRKERQRAYFRKHREIIQEQKRKSKKRWAVTK